MSIEMGGSPPGASRLGSAAFLTFDAGQGAKLRVGSVVSLRVLSEAGGGRWRLSIDGSILVARSERSLAVGENFRARVERGSADLVLVPLASPGEREAAFLSSLGLPVDAGSKAALLASFAAGLRPEASQIARIRKAASEPGVGEERLRDRAALAARLEAKGLASDSGAVDALEAIASGGRNADTDDSGSRREGENPGGDAQAGAQTGRLPTGPAEAADINGDEIARLAAMLQKFTGRYSGSGDEPDSGLLGLFNHLGRRAGVLIPFSIRDGSIVFEGSLLLHLVHPTGGLASIEGRFVALHPEEAPRTGKEWFFAYQPKGKGGSSLRVEAPAGEAKRDWGLLAAALKASGCELVAGSLDRQSDFFEEVHVEA